MALFKNKYRIESTRLKNWDYSWDGNYFITICTKNREHFFGKIVDGDMVLNNIGKIVYEQWYVSEKIRKNIILDEFIIMPNHIHGIVIVDNFRCRDVLAKRLYRGNHPNMSKISPKKTSISHMIREFKSAVTKIVRQSIPEFSWQSRFYDHIIRNEISLYNIRKYINNNPKMWNRDRNNKIGLEM